VSEEASEPEKRGRDMGEGKGLGGGILANAAVLLRPEMTA
jgi:hypothetical protein